LRGKWGGKKALPEGKEEITKKKTPLPGSKGLKTSFPSRWAGGGQEKLGKKKKNTVPAVWAKKGLREKEKKQPPVIQLGKDKKTGELGRLSENRGEEKGKSWKGSSSFLSKRGRGTRKEEGNDKKRNPAAGGAGEGDQRNTFLGKNGGKKRVGGGKDYSLKGGRWARSERGGE